jgi:two-component system sensor histidine kinase UhpB
VFAGYIGSCIDITEAKEAADAVRENEAALQASERKVQDLAGRLIAAQDTERARIARDLHDDVSQQLAGLSIGLSALRRRLLSLTGDERLRNDVVALQQRIISLAENVRHLSRDLHPDVLKHVGLAAALNAYCSDLQRHYGLSVDCAVEGSCDDITPAAAVCLYRVAQESLRNVVAHAAADCTEVRLIRTTEVIQLTIADDGRGFDIGHARADSKGLGLVSVNERVRLAGGTMSLVTERNKGTRVCVRIPLGQSTSATARARSARHEFMTSTPS